MTTEEVKKMEDEAIKEGLDCLYEKLGKTTSEQFLLIWYLRKIRESRGRDYTAWRHNKHYGHEDNPVENVNYESVNVRKLQYAH
jgi:hypothetical protein